MTNQSVVIGTARIRDWRKRSQWAFSRKKGEEGWWWWSAKKIQLMRPIHWPIIEGVHCWIPWRTNYCHVWFPRVRPLIRSLTRRALLCYSRSKIPSPPCALGRVIVSQETLTLLSPEPSPSLHWKFLSNLLTCLILSAWKHQHGATYHMVANKT